MKPIVLIGMMGSGKTTIGQALATDLNQTWMDTDDYIQQRSQQSIAAIFETKGEAYFRQLEEDALKELMKRYSVISTGGGVILSEANRQLLQKEAYVIYLKSEVSTLISRLKGTNRPLLQGGEMEKKLVTLLNQRMGFYQHSAHLTVGTDHLKVEEIINYIKNELASNDTLSFFVKP